MGRVRIGTCSGPAEAALVRAAFDAHGIPIVINAEQHASVLGGLGGAVVPLHVYAQDEHAEEAAALLDDLRDRDRGESEAEVDAEEAGDVAPIELRTWRRRRALGVILIGCFLTFGTAHMTTGAWFRGMALAGLQVLAITYLAAGEMVFGGVLFFACPVTDVIGALWRVFTSSPPMPVARVHR